MMSESILEYTANLLESLKINFKFQEIKKNTCFVQRLFVDYVSGSDKRATVYS